MPKLAPLDWPPIEVEVAATDPQLPGNAGPGKTQFRIHGRTGTHWSVITDERYLSESIESSEEEFFASGKQPVTELSLAAGRCGLRLGPGMTCFELGCGVGRSTIWLADIFDHVVASDVSAPHLRLAAPITQRFGKPTPASSISIARSLSTISRRLTFSFRSSCCSTTRHRSFSGISKILRKLNPGGMPTFRFRPIGSAIDSILQAISHPKSCSACRRCTCCHNRIFTDCSTRPDAFSSKCVRTALPATINTSRSAFCW